MSTPSYIHKTNSRSRRLTMKINKDGEVVITTPKLMPKFMIKRFVESNKDWIDKHKKKQKQKKSLFETEKFLMVFGKKYQKNLVFSERVSKISLAGKNLTINLLEGTKAKKTKEKELIANFLKNTAEKYIVPRTHQLAKKMKIKFGRIGLRQQSTRWGSCSSEGNLNFNWRLVHFEPEIIDYVIIHELAHRTHMDHSKNFWELVEKFDSSYRLHKGWLKRSGVGLG